MRKTVAVDLDGVLADFSAGWQGIEHIGDPIPGAVEFTKELAEFADIVIFTCRCCEDLVGNNGMGANLLHKNVQEWLDKHGFTYHDIYVGQGKPMASAYIDDRAVYCAPQVNKGTNADMYAAAIAGAKRFCAVEQDSGLPPTWNEHGYHVCPYCHLECRAFSYHEGPTACQEEAKIVAKELTRLRKVASLTSALINNVEQFDLSNYTELKLLLTNDEDCPVDQSTGENE